MFKSAVYSTSTNPLSAFSPQACSSKLSFATSPLKGQLGAHSIISRAAESGGSPLSSLFKASCALAVAGASYAICKYALKRKEVRAERAAEVARMETLSDEFDLDRADSALIEAIFLEFAAQEAEVALGWESFNDSRYDTDSETPADFICPITGEVIREPVLILEGVGESAKPQAYERIAITKWYESNTHHESPVSRSPLDDPSTYKIDLNLRMQITRYVLARESAKTTPKTGT